MPNMHLAEVAPSHCSSCFQQKPQMPHVDFMAFYDGPVVPEAVGVIPHVIDDLIVCEDCLKEAAAFIGLTREDALEAEIIELKQQLDESGERLQGLKTYVEALEEEREQRDKVLPLFTSRPVPPRKNQRRRPQGTAS